MPVMIGRSAPAVRPKEWKTGSAFSTLSSGEKSMTDRIWAILAWSARWDSTTPFGLPSDPEVNSTTAGCSGSRLRSTVRGKSRARRTQSRSIGPKVGFRSSRKSTVMPVRAATSCSIFACSRKAREVMTILIPAAVQASRMPVAPAL